MAELRGREHFVFEMPHLGAHSDAFVGSRFFQKLVELAEESGGVEEARLEFATHRKWVPEAFSLRLGEDGVMFFDHLVRTGLYLALSYGAVASDDAASAAKLREPLFKELRAFALPEIELEVRFAAAATASELFALAREQISKQPPEAGRVTLSESSIHYEVAATDVLEPNQAALAAVALRVARADDEELMALIDETVQRQRLEVELKLAGDSISLELSSPGHRRASGGKANGVNTRPLLAGSGADTVFWTAAELGALRRGAAEWSAILARFEGTPAYITLAAADEEDALGSLRSLSRELGDTGDRVASVLRTTPAGLEIETRAVGGPPVAPLDGSPVLGLNRPEFAITAVRGDSSIGTLLAAQLERFENRMATNWLKGAATGDGSENRWDMLSKVYYAAFDDFRRLLLDDRDQVFQRPSAVICNLQGELTWQPSAGQGKPAKRETYPVPELAVVGRVESPEAAKRRVQEMYEELAKGFLNAVGRARTKESVTYEPLDVGAKERAMRFSGNWLSQVIPGKLGRLRGDVDPHFVAAGPWLVISTSPRLTRQIMERLAAAPPSSDVKNMVAIGHLEATSVADYLVRLFARIDPDSAKKMQSTLLAIGRMVPHIEGYTRDEGETRVSRGEIRLATP